MSPGEFGGTARFQLQSRLGQGGFGVVYKALDRERNTLVALKLLRHVAPKSLYSFKQEFRALADVSHPNLVTLYELASEGDDWFFTMELIDGVSFLRYVRDDLGSDGGFKSNHLTATSSGSERFFEGEDRDESPSGAALAAVLNLDRLRDALPQLSDGVLALHAAGKLHRDIKPSNVLVSREGRVTLLDFGLVKELALDETDTVAGTPAYMSPEQAAGLPLAEASDWYNVGSMLYEALTGCLPFSGSSLEVLRQKEKAEPPAPIELVPGIPRDLDALCRDLLRRDPARRPSGAEVRRRLKGGRRDDTLPAPSPPSVAPFVGRKKELEALGDAFRTVKQGRTVTVSVRGGSALGKTALVKRFLEHLREEDEAAVILSGRCYERESVPYKALDSLVDALSQYLRRLPSAQAEALLPHDIFALVRLFPVLRQVGAVARARRAILEIPDSQELRRRAFAALRELLVRLSDRRPLVLFIDDMQWGDVDSAALLEALLRPPDPPVLLLIGCYRSEDALTGDFLKLILRLRQNVGPGLEGRDIEIGELPAEEARELALALLAGDDGAATTRAEAIARESRGNPYFVEELSRFAQGGALDPGRAGLAAEVTLNEVIEARVSGLSAAARRLLDVVAVAGQPIEPDVAYRAAELEREGPRVLADLRAAHLVRMRTMAVRDEAESYHDRIRGAVVGHLTPDLLRDCHQRLALSLLASGRTDPEILSAHFLGAGDAQSAAEYAAAAAAKASEALAFDRAASLYRFALNLRAEAHLEDADLAVKLGDALANAGRGTEAAQAYLSAVKDASAAQAVDLHRRAAQQFLTSGHIEEGLSVMNTALANLAMPLPETPRRAFLSLLARRAWIRLRGLGFKERDETHVSPQELLRIDACWSVAVGLSHVDMLRGADFQARHLLLALRAGEPYRVARALGLEVAYLSMSGNRSRRRTERVSQRARALAERVGNPHALGLQTLTAGIAAWLEGRWGEARELCERAETTLRERCTGVVWEIMSAQSFQLAALFFLGEVKELSRRLPTLLKEAEERGDLLSATFLRIAYCNHVAWLAADDPQRARQELEAALAKWRRGKFDYLNLWAHGARTDISIYSGEGDAVLPRVEGRYRLFARSLDRFVQAGSIRGLDSRARRRLAAAAQRENPSERDALLRGAESHARAILRERTRWADPLAFLLRAGAAATRGETARSLALLEPAESAFTAADMALHAAVTRRRRGELMGGEAGSDLVTAADAWMSGQDIVNPARMAQMLAPGRWRAD
jgi:serine/threonine protein kinase